jgi:hypothetical protein
MGGGGVLNMGSEGEVRGDVCVHDLMIREGNVFIKTASSLLT